MLAKGGGNKIEIAKAELDCAAICAVGDIASSIIEPATSTATAGTSVTISADIAEDFLPKYGPAPEYAIERGRPKNGIISFFELGDDYYNAPTRLARDPRHRQEVPTVTTVNPEDNWRIPGREIMGR
jgi:hypothetical protein